MVAEHVFVEELAAPDAEDETAVEKLGAGRGGLGCWRMIGQVTAVVTVSRVLAAMAPIMLHTKPDSPCHIEWCSAGGQR